MKLAKFKVDCTPPVGVPVGFGTEGKTIGIRDQLWLRGIILADENKKCLIASMDYCGLMNRAHDELVGKLAEATGIPEEFIIVHCIHQHDAPLIDFEINEILKIKTFPADWWKNLLAACAQAGTTALANMLGICYIGHAETRLYGYASNRRIIGDDGKCRGMRWSRCNDESLRNETTGVIDPFIRTIAFMDSDENIVASMSFYATHPQVANGRNMFSADAPGEAMRLIENEFENSFPCFFTGAGGNVTAGKYTLLNDLEGNLLNFGQKLANGISRNLIILEKEACREFHLSSEKFKFPRKKMGEFTSQTESKDEPERLLNAVLQSCREYKNNTLYCARMLQMGNVRIVFLPGEPFVEYQIYLQSLIPDEFIAIAGNCSDNFIYLPLSESFKEGGYEPQSYCWCTSDIEKILKRNLKKLIYANCIYKNGLK